MLSDFVAGDTDSLPPDTTDVDPVSEADVYIAYGRYQQAEQLLRQSMDNDPDRLALPHKLLEVYYATRKPAAFVGLAGEMMADGRDKKDTGAWDRVKEMGRELAPDNPIFTAVAGSATVASFAEAAQARSQTTSASMQDDIGLSELASGFSLDADSETIDGDTDNLDLTKELEGLSRELEAGTLDDDDSIPLHELESLDLDLPETTSIDVTADDDVIPFKGSSLKEKDNTSDPRNLQAELEELSDLSSFEINLTESEQIGDRKPTTQLHDVVLDIEDDKEDEDLLLDTADQGSVFGEEDVATKLELARAYVDMGDEEGARSILAEVQEEGSAEQKGQAREMLQKLGT
jgi:pilus assembly protein FimV